MKNYSFKQKSALQKKQQQLSWALRICTGFRGSIHLIPDSCIFKPGLKVDLDATIADLRYQLKHLKEMS